MVMNIDCVREKLYCFHLRLVERSFIEHMDSTASYFPELLRQLFPFFIGTLEALGCLLTLDSDEHKGTYVE